ncbi:tripartite tricarboxylate transporter substrate binding protein [Ramlibacter henchirensis]|uniref:Tripartite tricarboxylate transporter substrate binding protein n=1 Tax=Ramlibacter henchirensis TaxID=204072 RepID=A0A4Z0BXN1_9BURK|nr:tripartite tricarboxylate transporter substrate binding protein [Ramlibacter henchirensis]TFZ02689.1 tripartite tricarboxylate transporter substrate binding protein [Ramlibacter henchirensis]
MHPNTRSMTPVTRRVALAAAACALCGAAFAQAWPERAIKLVVPFPAGGGADAAARAYGDKLSAALGQPVIIDNRPGASGNIGAELVARGPADGYTLLFANEFLATNPLMFKEIRYDTLRDFTPIAKVASTAVAIAVHPSVPAKTMQELLALARTRPLNYASPGVGTGPHLFGQLIALNAGAKLNNVPYKGSAPAMADAVGGQVDFIISTLAPMVPHLQSGKLRGLAVTGAKRSPQAPDVPTLAETGSVAQRYEVWYGVVAPAATPKPVLARLLQASTQVLRDPELLNKLRVAGYEVEPTIGDDFGAEIRADQERWARVIRDAKIQRE